MLKRLLRRKKPAGHRGRGGLSLQRVWNRGLLLVLVLNPAPALLFDRGRLAPINGVVHGGR